MITVYVYILVKGTIAITAAGINMLARLVEERNKQALFEKCALFTDCMSEINNTRVDNAKDRMR